MTAHSGHVPHPNLSTGLWLDRALIRSWFDFVCICVDGDFPERGQE